MILTFNTVKTNLTIINSMTTLKNRYYCRVEGRKCTDKHTVTLYIRLRHAGETEQLKISTGLKIALKDWNAEKQTTKDHTINEILRSKQNQILDYIGAMLNNNMSCNIDNVKQWIKRNELGKMTFLQIALNFLEIHKNNVRPSTYRCAESGLINLLEKCGLSNKNPQTLSPKALENIFINVKRQYMTGSFKQVFCYLEMAIKQALRNELINADPLARLDKKSLLHGEVKRKKTIPEPGETEKLIKNLPERSKSLAEVQHFTALSWIDLKNLKPENFIESGGVKYIVIRRQKTGIESVIPISAEVFEKWQTITNINYDTYKRDLKNYCNITGTHSIRHARAREILNKSVPIEALSRLMGHASTQMTLTYAPISSRMFSDIEIKGILRE